MTGSVRSVAQAFGIMRLLADSPPLTLSEVVATTGLSPSSCLNLLRTLVAEGIVEREGRSKRYTLMREWAEAEPLRDGRAHTVVLRLRPHIARLARRHAVAVGLWKIVPGNRTRLLANAQSDEPMRIQITDGQRQPLGAGAVGRALAAAQDVDDGELARRFAGVRWPIPMPLTEYIASVRQAARDGFAIDDGRAFLGVCTVAVALSDPYAGFCVSASAFSGSKTPTEIAQIGSDLAGFLRE